MSNIDLGKKILYIIDSELSKEEAEKGLEKLDRKIYNNLLLDFYKIFSEFNQNLDNLSLNLILFILLSLYRFTIYG